MYKIKEIAGILGVSDRSVERYLKSYFSIEKGAYQVSEKMLEVLKLEYLEGDNDTVVEQFTKEEYQEFHKRLSEYPILKEQIQNSKEYLNTIENQMEYFKNAYNKQLEMHENLVQSVKNFSDNLMQRNYIEAKEKGLDQ